MEGEVLPDNVINVSSHGKVRHYVGYGERVLLEMHRDVVVIVGKAKAISKAVTVAEILKRSVPGLHQETTIALETSVDRWEPTEQQLDRLEVVRHVPTISIRLSPAALDPTHLGYQPPAEPAPARSAAPAAAPAEPAAPARASEPAAPPSAQASRGRGGRQGGGRRGGANA